jgi:hypothetical protein
VSQTAPHGTTIKRRSKLHAHKVLVISATAHLPEHSEAKATRARRAVGARARSRRGRVEALAARSMEDTRED